MNLSPIALAIAAQHGMLRMFQNRSRAASIYARVGLLSSLQAPKRGVDGERLGT